MVRPKKTASKKKNPGSIDFKKIKRKVGRKLPPPTNSTDTHIRSKAIVLPEQSVLSNRTGMAVSRKGLTLKELLQQTSHHNAKTRKSALLGVSDLLKKNPSELKAHSKGIMEKLRERISDGDKDVRDTLFHLLKKSIFPASKEDASIIPLTMAYVFNAMTHLVLDIRLSAFNFFDLIVTCYPTSFYPYSDQIIDNYMHILQNSQIYIHDRVKFKSVIGGLERCLCLLCSEEENTGYKDRGLKKTLFSYKEVAPRDVRRIKSVVGKLKELLPILVICFQEFASSNHTIPTVDGISFVCMICMLQCIKAAVCFLLTEINRLCSSYSWQFRVDSYKSIMCILIKLWQYFPFRSTQKMTEKEDERYYALNTRICEIYMHITNRINLTGAQKENFKEKFLEFLEDSLNGQVCSDCHLNHSFPDKYLVSILPLFPGFVLDLECGWKNRLLKAFTRVFQDCKLESKLNLACLSTIEDMLPSNSDNPSSDIISPNYQHFQISWLKKLLCSLLLAGDTNPSLSKKILILMHKMGQCCFVGSSINIEYNNLQNQFMEFFCTIADDDSKHYGAFYKLPEDCQEQAMYCLAYFSRLNFDVLRSMLYSCLCPNPDAQRFISLRMIDIVTFAYERRCVQKADYMSFMVSIMCRFKVSHDKFESIKEGHAYPSESNRDVYRSITDALYHCFNILGDRALVLRDFLNPVLDWMHLKPSLEITRAILRMIVLLDSRLSKISEEKVIVLNNIILFFMVDGVSKIPKDLDEDLHLKYVSACEFYMMPCIYLFVGSQNLLERTLQIFISMTETRVLPASQLGSDLNLLTRVNTVAFVLITMFKSPKLPRYATFLKKNVKEILKNIFNILYSDRLDLTELERHEIKCSFDRLKMNAYEAKCLDSIAMEGLQNEN